MKARPILFQAEMVRALLSGLKTQTRRICKVKDANGKDFSNYGVDAMAALIRHRCPYGQPGDLLWVREAWRLFEEDECGCSEYPCGCPSVGTPFFRANQDDGESKWKPSIHMRRSISRLTLRITDVRVERVQAITDGDAMAEGITVPYEGPLLPMLEEYASDDIYNRRYKCWPRAQFGALWDSINKNWAENPYVWVVEFEVIQANVDQVLQEKAA